MNCTIEMLDLSWKKSICLYCPSMDAQLLVGFLCIYCEYGRCIGPVVVSGAIFSFYTCVGLYNTISQVFEGEGQLWTCRVLGCFEFATLWIGYEYNK